MAHSLTSTSNRYGGIKTSTKPVKVGSLSGDATLKKSVRKSTGNLASHLSSTMPINGANLTSKSSSDLEKIESEYIKNLQQQVYFLELETNYLRDEARKATELQPQMKAEAQQMVVMLAELQSDVNKLQIDLKRKTAELDIAANEKERLLGKMKASEDSHQREKRLLQDEIVQLKKEKELLERSIVNKDAEIIDVHKQLETSNSALRTDENKIRLLETQLAQKSEQLVLVQHTLDDKRAELLKAEAKLHETEDKYYSSAATINEKVKDDLREEIRLLKQKLKETEQNQDRYVRSKLNEDSAHLVKENAYLNDQVSELKKQIDKERSVHEISDNRRSEQNQLRNELEQTKEQLKLERQKLEQCEQTSTGLQLSLTTARSRVSELTLMHQSVEEQLVVLRREKDQVSSSLAEQHKQVTDRDSKINELESRLRDLEPLEELHSTIHSDKWEEFSRLANSMKTLARRTPSNQSSRSGTRSTSFEYS